MADLWLKHKREDMFFIQMQTSDLSTEMLQPMMSIEAVVVTLILGYQTIQTNSQFAGYPNFALNGETKLILNAAYRFPITLVVVSQIKRLRDPYIFRSLCSNIRTGKNLWSYSPSDPSQYYRSRYGERSI